MDGTVAEIQNKGKILSLILKSTQMTEADKKICVFTVAVEVCLKSRFWIFFSAVGFSAQSCLVISQ